MSIQKKSNLLLFPKFGKVIIVIIAIAFIIAGLRAYQLFNYVFDENVKNNTTLLIPENATFEQVVDSLIQKDALLNYKAFIWVAKKKKYNQLIKPGKFEIIMGQNTNSIVNMLRGGNQKPVKVTFNSIRFKEEFSAAISKYIRPDSIEVLSLFENSELIKEYGFIAENFHSMFIPNTYEMYWTTSVEGFAKRMKLEYESFWNDSRKKKAKQLGLTQIEVSTLASIVQEETIKKDEKPVVAGLYINRLRKGIALQADPTIKYAIGDFSIRRVLNKHLKIDSPYNTYKYAGLPPGPVNFPEISSIDAVLNYEEHNYLYMCSKEDFSGYHNFARTNAEHNRNARKYHRALNDRKIWK